MNMFKAVWGIRTLTTSSRLYASDLIQDAFVRNVRSFAKKFDSGELFQSKEASVILEDELNRLARKFHMENYAAAKSLTTTFEIPRIDSAVQKILGGKKIEELIAEVKKDISAYEEKRRIKAEEDERFAVLTAFDTHTMESFTSSTKEP